MVSRPFNCILLLVLLGFTQCKSGPPPGDPDNGGLLLPSGFEAVVVVDSLSGRARHLAVNDNGDIYVKLMHPAKGGGNAALRDTDHDGKADIVEYFGKYDDWGYGTAMRIHNGYLYFSSEMVVYRCRLRPRMLVPGRMEVILTDDHQHGRHEHIAKPLAFDDKGYMYVPFGAPSDACQEMNRIPGSPGQNPCQLLEDHGGVWRFDANKIGQVQKDGQRFATGLRSVVAMDWNKAYKNLYLLQHGRDDLFRTWPTIFSPWKSAVLPSEEFLIIKEGTDAGWPYYYYDQINQKKLLNPEYGGDGKKEGNGRQYEQPLIGFPGHWAPNDLVFYNGNEFPDHYKHGAFIAFHGSTNRAPYPQSGYFICFVPFDKGKPSGPWEVFADGFAKVDPIISVSDAVYRPMGIAIGPDGSMYVSDSEKGKIWRIMYKGDKNKFGPGQLAQIEKRKLSAHIRTPDEMNDNLDRGKPASGEKVYDTYCRSCHQENGKGDGNRFPPLDSSEWVTGDKKQLLNVLLKGLQGPIEVRGKPYNGTMPQHSFLSDEDMAEVLTYIRQNFNNKASAVKPEEVNQVRNIMKNKKVIELPIEFFQNLSCYSSSKTLLIMLRRELIKHLSLAPLAAGAVGSGFPFQSAFAAPPGKRDLFKELGVRTFINAAGTLTYMTGSLMHDYVLDTIRQSSRDFCLLDELQDKVGERIAQMVHSEAATITAGCYSAMVLGMAGVLTGMDEKKVQRLPFLEGTGMKSEVIVQHAHNVGYVHAMTNTGVSIVPVETRQDAEKAINDKTAMTWFLNANAPMGKIQHEEWVEIGKKNKIPSMIDIAADVPPVENLWKYNDLGFDLVCVSGGKAICGPQSAGILMGRKHLVAAARLSASPRGNNIGRGMKVNKEEILGMYVALEKYIHQDHQKVWKMWEDRTEIIHNAVKNINGVAAEKIVPAVANHTPGLNLKWDKNKVKLSRTELQEKLRDGHPSIEVMDGDNDSIRITVFMLKPGQEKIVARRLHEELSEASS